MLNFYAKFHFTKWFFKKALKLCIIVANFVTFVILDIYLFTHCPGLEGMDGRTLVIISVPMVIYSNYFQISHTIQNVALDVLICMHGFIDYHLFAMEENNDD